MKKKKLIIFVLAIVFITLGVVIFNQQAKSKNIKDNMKLVNKYVQDGKYEEAELALLKVISVEPKNIEARIQLAKAYTAEKKYDKAEQTLKDAIAIDVNDPAPKEELAKLYILQGKELLSAGKLNDAKGMFDEAVEVDESRVKTYSEIADYYETTAGKVSEAMVILTKGYEETKDSGLKSRLDDMKEKITGNTNGNLINGGLVVQKGEWIYYVGLPVQNQFFTLYKVKADGTGKTMLDDYYYQDSEINVIGDWSYYIRSKHNSVLSKIQTNGSGENIMMNIMAESVNVVGDWVYYCGYEFSLDAGGNGYIYELYKIRTDGTGKMKLSTDYPAYINVQDDWIYYCNVTDNNKIYKIKNDGTGRMKISEDNAEFINVIGDWIYYSNVSDNYKIYKIKTDGSEKTPLNQDRSSNINVSGDWIYYSNKSDGDKLYKIRTDGTGRTKLNDDSTYSINVTGGWIYYITKPDLMSVNDCLYRIKPDGTGRMEFK